MKAPNDFEGYYLSNMLLLLWSRNASCD